MTWSRVQLRRVAKLGTGHTPSRQHPEYWEQCTIPWLTLSDVWQLRDGTRQVVEKTAESISELGVANSSAVVHPAGTVALSRTASVGFSCILGRAMATSQDFATWTCGPLLNNRYLLWALRAMPEIITSLKMGSTHQTIYMPDIEGLSVPLPPLATQHSLADYLDADTARIDALIAKKRRMIELLDERFEARLTKHLFERNDPWASLARACRCLPGYSFASQEMMTTPEDGIRLLRGVNIGVGAIRWEDVVYYPESSAAGVSDYTLQVGDLVVGMDRPVIADGMRVARIESDDVPALLVQRVARVRANERTSNDYLRFLLMSRAFVSHYSPITTGVSVPHISAEQIMSFRFPLPSPEQQEAIIRDLSGAERSTRNTVRALDRQIGLLVEHRQALITAAVTGEFAVPGVAA